jgi:hypothetical protein
MQYWMMQLHSKQLLPAPENPLFIFSSVPLWISERSATWIKWLNTVEYMHEKMFIDVNLLNLGFLLWAYIPHNSLLQFWLILFCWSPERYVMYYLDWLT